jgi:hypothetical protein
VCSAGHGAPQSKQDIFIFSSVLKRLDLATNSSDPVVLIELASDPEKRVREIVAKNKGTPLLPKMILARDREPSIQKVILEVAIKDGEDMLLEILAESQIAEVRAKARETIEQI